MTSPAGSAWVTVAAVVVAILMEKHGFSTASPSSIL